jgi:cytochrome c biogenesis protein CcmG, thiol:disulfide interchange protein DsbE
MSDGTLQATPQEPKGAIPSPHGGGARRRIFFALPTLVFAVLVGYFIWGLNPERDPSEIPSVLIGKPVPDFDLPPVEGRELGLATGDLKGEVSLVNVFASWCTECRREHPFFMNLRANDIVPIHGLNYKDKPEDARGWLDELGDPYTRTGADISGRVGIDFGVYGVPETFVIDKNGMIAYKHIGAVTGRVLKEKILPLIEELRKATP